MDRFFRDATIMMRKLSRARRDRGRLNVAGRRNDAVAINVGRPGDVTHVASHQSVHVVQNRGLMSKAVAETTSARAAPSADESGSTSRPFGDVSNRDVPEQ